MRLLTVLFAFILVCPIESAGQAFVRTDQNSDLAGAANGNGVSVADFDQDGDMDVFFVARSSYDASDTKTLSRLFRNDSGSFTDVTLSSGIVNTTSGFTVGQMGNEFGAAWGDYDNDGFPDLFISQIGPDLLYRNNGDGTFEDVSISTGVRGSNNNAHHSSAMWWDYDVDGDLDLYVSNWTGVNSLFRNDDGQFVDVSAASGTDDPGQAWSAIPIDANFDGYPDLYVVNDFGDNTFFLSNGDGTFSDATTQYALHDEGHGMGVAIGDCNNDGLFDIYLTNDSSFYPNPLFIGSASGPFEDHAADLGVDEADWAWGTEFFDYDNDMDQDLYVVNGFPVAPGRNYLFENSLSQTGTASFDDVSDASGADGEPDARGMVILDFDNDGRQDILVANWHGQPYLYRNETEDTGNWVAIRLVGTTSNRDALGAVVALKSGGTVQYRHNDGVEFLGQSLTPVHFGLGDNSAIDEITVTWPTGEQETFTGLEVNQTVTITEGVGATDLQDEIVIPKSLSVSSVYPNPFRTTTAIEISAASSGTADLEVVDVSGRIVLREGIRLSGSTTIFKLDRSSLPGSGLYFVRVRHDSAVATTSIVVLP